MAFYTVVMELELEVEAESATAAQDLVALVLAEDKRIKVKQRIMFPPVKESD